MNSIEEMNEFADIIGLPLVGEDMDALLADMARYMAVADLVKNADLSGLGCSDQIGGRAK